MPPTPKHNILEPGKGCWNRYSLLFILSLIFVLGIIIKIIFWNRAPYISRDSVYYLEQIEKWAQLGDRVYFESLSGTFCPPLFFSAVQLLNRMGFSSLYSALSLNIMMGSLLPIIIFFIAKELSHNNKIAISSSLIAAFHPTINELSIEVQRDTGYLFFSCLFVLEILLNSQSSSKRHLIIAGLCMSMAILFRIEALELYPLAILYFLRSPHKTKLKAKINKCICFSVSAGILFWGTCTVIGMQYKDIKNVWNNYFNRVEHTGE